MGASPTFMQGLLQSLSPWMTGANPSSLDNATSQYGGTSGLLDAMMQGAGPDTSQAREGAALQRARALALQQAGQRQQLAMGNLGVAQNMAMFPFLMGALRQYGGQPQASPQVSPGASSAAAPQPTDAPPMLRATPQQLQAQGQPQSYQPPAASQGAPQGASQGGPNPNLQSGLNLARVMALMGRPGANTFLQSLTSDPSYLTQAALAKDPLTLDRAEMADAQQRGDGQGYLSAYTKMLTDANRLHISSMSGNVTGFGLPPWVLQSMANYNPQSGKITANGRQSLIPGAADTEAALEAARAGAEAAEKAANTPRNIPTAGGGSRFGYPSDIIGAPPALRGGVTNVNPAPQTSSGTGAAANPSANPATPKGDVWSTVPKLDVPQNVGEADYFTKGRLEGAGRADVELASKLSEESATADQQLEYNREAMQELPGAEVGPMSEWLTHARSALIEAGVPEGLIPKNGTVVPTLELNKSLKNAALQGARQLYGSRMTQTEVKLQTDEMSPSASMMRDAISSLMQQNNVRLMYAKAKAADYVIYRQHGGDPTRYESWYATKFPVQQFARAAASMTPDQLRAAAKQQGISQ